MDQADQPSAQQNVQVDGNGNTVIVALGDVVIRLLLWRPRAKLPNSRGHRWLGVPTAAGVVSFVSTVLFVIGMQGPPGWPEGKSALCRDGWYSASHTRSGTCSSHGGVATWRFAADDPYWRR